MGERAGDMMNGDGFTAVTKSENIGGGIDNSADSDGMVLPLATAQCFPQLRLLCLHKMALHWPKIGLALWSRTAESMKSMQLWAAMRGTLHHSLQGSEPIDEELGSWRYILPSLVAGVSHCPMVYYVGVPPAGGGGRQEERKKE